MREGSRAKLGRIREYLLQGGFIHVRGFRARFAARRFCASFFRFAASIARCSVSGLMKYLFDLILRSGGIA
jgi:hypothetical protein